MNFSTILLNSHENDLPEVNQYTFLNDTSGKKNRLICLQYQERMWTESFNLSYLTTMNIPELHVLVLNCYWLDLHDTHFFYNVYTIQKHIYYSILLVLTTCAFQSGTRNFVVRGSFQEIFSRVFSQSTVKHSAFNKSQPPPPNVL